MTIRILLVAAGLVLGTGLVAAQEAENDSRALPATPKILSAPATGSTNLLAETIPTSKGFLVGWTNTDGALNGKVMVRSFSPTGIGLKPVATLKSAFLLSGKPKFAPLGGDKFAVVWKQFSLIEGGVYSLATNKITGVKTDLGKTLGAVHHEIVTLANGRVALITMENALGSATRYLIRVSTFDKTLKKLSGPVTMNGNGYDSFATSRDFTIVDGKAGGFAIWRDRPSGNLFMKAFNANGAATGAQIKVNTTALPPGTGVDVANFGVEAVKLTDDRILVTWTSLEGSSGYDIRARLFSANGAPIGQDFRVNTNRIETQYFPEPVALAGGKFSIAWVSNVFTTLTRTHFIRTYAKNGVAMSGPKTTHVIPPVPTDSNVDTSIAVLKDGSLVNVFHEGAGQAVVGDGIPATLLK